MSNSRLLKENTIRRFMKLANVGTLTDNFIQEKYAYKADDGDDDEKDKEEVVKEQEDVEMDMGEEPEEEPDMEMDTLIPCTVQSDRLFRKRESDLVSTRHVPAW